jgi:hypothetical protein
MNAWDTIYWYVTKFFGSFIIGIYEKVWFYIQTGRFFGWVFLYWPLAILLIYAEILLNEKLKDSSQHTLMSLGHTIIWPFITVNFGYYLYGNLRYVLALSGNWQNLGNVDFVLLILLAAQVYLVIKGAYRCYDVFKNPTDYHYLFKNSEHSESDRANDYWQRNYKKKDFLITNGVIIGICLILHVAFIPYISPYIRNVVNQFALFLPGLFFVITHLPLFLLQAALLFTACSFLIAL